MEVVIVAGMHRSGTSCIASELLNSGLGGSDQLLPGDAANPNGYFEDPRIIALHESILSSLGSNWMGPASLPSDWLEKIIARDYVRFVEAYLLEFASSQNILMIKDPRISLLLPFWKYIFEKNGIKSWLVHVWRNPLDVCHSLWRRNNIPSGHALQLYLRYNLEICKNSSDFNNIDIEFDAFLAEPQMLAVLLAAIGLNLPDGNSLGGTSDEKLRTVLDHKLEGGHLPHGVDASLLRGLNAQDVDEMTRLYDLCGGDALAEERRHYGVIHSTLWTVVEELQQATEKATRDIELKLKLREWLGV